MEAGIWPQWQDEDGQHWCQGSDQIQQAIEKAKKRFKPDGDVKILSCYEAGRDGFWLHRYLLSCGIDNLVVDSSSIEVNRRKRRAKTDRIDAKKLLAMLIRYHGYAGVVDGGKKLVVPTYL